MKDSEFKKTPAYIEKNKEKSFFASTVGSVIKLVLPNGTQLSPSVEPDWCKCPDTPADVFAVTGYLLEQSGALSFFGAGSDKPYRDYPRLFLKDTEADDLERLAKRWRKQPDQFPKAIQRLWSQLLAFSKFPVSYRAYKFSTPPQNNNQYWWKPAFKLFTIADSTCDGMGFTPFNLNENTVASEFWKMRLELPGAAAKHIEDGAHDFEVPSTIAYKADPDVVCVQPKSLVPSLGAGTRVFSRNLSLLKSRGIVRTQWIVQSAMAKNGADKGLNVLVIPLPFSYDKSEFITKALEDESLRKKTNVFELRQSWLDDEPFEEFLQNARKFIAEVSQAKNQPIHVIVLPELAMNQQRFKEFAKAAKMAAPKLEFLIAGSSENCETNPKKGNYIWIRKFTRCPHKEEHTSDDGFVDISQGKHHRWQLEKYQINDYEINHGVDDGLSPLEVYWENFSGRPRELNFLSYRENSVFTGVVCEDLARSEPCHEIIKALGPNLLFALLMDGPQIDQRWGAKYASLFSEDHGGSVMTVSSLALVEKSQRKRAKKDQSYSVVYFRSPAMDKTARFECKNKNLGVFIRLIPSDTSSPRILIDGREKVISDWVLDPDFHKDDLK